MFIFLIKEKREEKGITQEELAEMTGLSQNYISDLENNKKKNPTLEAIHKISLALNENIRNLFIATSDIETLREMMHESIDKNGINSEETLKISHLIDKLVVLKMEENGMS